MAAFLLKKARGYKSPRSANAPHLGIGGGTPAVTPRTWDMGGETPAKNLLGSRVLYAIFREFATVILWNRHQGRFGFCLKQQESLIADGIVFLFSALIQF